MPHAQTHDDVTSIKELRSHLMEEIREFFVDYNKLRDCEFRPHGEVGPGKAKSC
jgi:inorganic pyrophosphatase